MFGTGTGIIQSLCPAPRFFSGGKLKLHSGGSILLLSALDKERGSS
ncbi:CDC73_C domain-containing protein [Psidium guajava]|nr:CDC73_C domain-containing protein [Psidium guajava]